MPQELTAEQSRELFERAAQRALGLTGDEFLTRWDRGEYDIGDEDPAVIKLAMLIPFVRPARSETGPC